MMIKFTLKKSEHYCFFLKFISLLNLIHDLDGKPDLTDFQSKLFRIYF